MRTKTLLVTLALSAACAIPSIAQVYSVNAVGYVNQDVPTGFSLIANPLKQTDTRLATLIPSPTPGTVIYKYANGAYQISTFDDLDLVWLGSPGPDMTLDNGGGFFIYNPGAKFTVTWVGEVNQSSGTALLTNTVPKGFSMQSSFVPQAGTMTQLFGYAGTPKDTVYKYANVGGYSIFTFDDLDLVWLPSEPSFSVGESFFFYRDAAGTINWTRNFSVNN